MIFLVTNRKRISNRELQKRLKIGYKTVLRNRKKIEKILDGIIDPHLDGVINPQRIGDYRKLMGIVDVRDVLCWARRNYEHYEERRAAALSRKKQTPSIPPQPSPTQIQNPAEPSPPDKPAA